MASLLTPRRAPLPTGPRRWRSGRPRSGQLQLAALLGLAAISAVVASQAPDAGRALIGVFGLASWLLVAMRNRERALVFTIGFLVLLGFIRRLLIPFAGWAENDPLLLVSPAMAVALWYLGRGSRAPRGFLSSAVGILMLWCLAQVLNPYEPALVVSMQSLIFIVTPLMWFFVGRTFDRDAHEHVHRVILWMAVPVVALGLYHSFGQFFGFELTWVGVSGQSAAIFLPGFQVRPFSTLTSPQEYGYYLGFVLVILWSKLLYRPTRPGLVAAGMLITTVALFLQASRSIFVFYLLALAVTALVRYRSPVTVLCIFGVVALLVLYTLGSSAPSEEAVEVDKENKKGAIQTLIDHELSGLTDPGSSTGPLHIDLVIEGLEQGVREPLGLGVSHGSIAETRSGTIRKTTSESDIGNVAAGLGAFAGLVLMGLVIGGLLLATRLVLLQPGPLHLAALGFGVIAFGQWSTGALYCTSTILWFTLGGLARRWAVRDATDPWVRLDRQPPGTS